MSRPDVMVLAKQGNPQAVKALLYREIDAMGMAFRVTERDRCLYVLVEGEKIPEEQTIASAIYEVVVKLQPDNINQITIFGRRLGDKGAIWQRSTDLSVINAPPSELKAHALDSALDIELDTESESAPELLSEPPLETTIVNVPEVISESTYDDLSNRLTETLTDFSLPTDDIEATSQAVNLALDLGEPAIGDLALEPESPNNGFDLDLGTALSLNEDDQTSEPDLSPTPLDLPADMETSPDSLDLNLLTESLLPELRHPEEQPTPPTVIDTLDEPLLTSPDITDSLDDLSSPTKTFNLDVLPTPSDLLIENSLTSVNEPMTLDLTTVPADLSLGDAELGQQETSQSTSEGEITIQSEPESASIEPSQPAITEAVPDPWEGAIPIPQVSSANDTRHLFPGDPSTRPASSPTTETTSPESSTPPETPLRGAKDLLDSFSAIDTQTLFNKPEALVLFVWLSALLLWQFYVLVAEEEGNLNRGLSSYKLSARLGIRRRTLVRQKNRPGFDAWSRNLDPDGYAWEYRGNGRYYPLDLPTIEVATQS